MVQTNKQQPLVSIIAIFYNADKYVAECVESIINQIYKNIEIILVNNGSSDDTGSILNEYERRDSRIHVLHNDPNVGPNYARRDGFVASSGEYICFVDGDDVITDKYAEVLLDILKTTDSDIANIGIKQYYADTKIAGFVDEYLPDKTIMLNGFDAIYRENNVHSALGSVVVWNKIYKRELFDNLDWEFANVRLGEDMLKVIQLNYAAKQIAVNPTVAYFARQRKSSQTKSIAGSLQSEIQIAEDWVDEHLAPEIRKSRNQRFDADKIGVELNERIAFLVDKGNFTRSEIKGNVTKLFSKYSEWKSNEFLSKNTRLSLNILSFSPSLYILVRKLMVKFGLVNNTFASWDAKQKEILRKKKAPTELFD